MSKRFRQASRRYSTVARESRHASRQHSRLIALGGATVAAVALALSLGIYGLTRPPDLKQETWPAFAASISGQKEGEKFVRQVWWRKTTWCARVVKPEPAWSTLRDDAAATISTLEDGKIMEVVREGAAGPLPGFGREAVKEAEEAMANGDAESKGIAEVAGRRAFVIESHRLPSRPGKTWWIDVDDGITLGYRERDARVTFVDWRFTKIDLVDKAPWTDKDTASLDNLAAGPFALISIRQSESLSANDQIVPSDQHPQYVELAGRIFSVCRPGHSEEVPDPPPLLEDAPLPGPG